MSAPRAWAFALLVSLAPLGAFAQPADASQRALALGYEGDGLYAKGRWAEAYDRFAQADALAHSPVFVLYMARCRKNAGKLLEARAIYDRVAGETVPPDAPRPFREAIADAAAERQELGKRIPSILVVVKGAPAGEVTVRVDGRAVPAGTAVPLDPAAHRVVATRGGRTAEKTVVLAESAGTVRVELGFDAAPPAEVKGSLAPAAVALTVGLLGVGVGAVTGAIAAAKTSDIEDGCGDDGHCPTTSAGELDTANAFATTSTIGFVAGGVGLATALVLYLARPGGSATPTVRARARGGLLLVGSF
jgi:hypothetical protein